MVRFHRLLVYAVADGLREIFSHDKQADRVVEKILKSDQRRGARDRAFVASGIYDCVRWWRLLVSCSGIPKPETQAEYLQVVGTHYAMQGHELPDWPEWSGVSPTSVGLLRDNMQQHRAIAQSIPDWLDQMGEDAFGAQWNNELTALNTPAEVVLRVNTQRTSCAQLQRQLDVAGWPTQTTPLAGNALVVKKRGNITATEAFKAGLFEIQDAASQCIAPFLEVSAGQTVIDACAGAGGKSLQLATLMRNKGRIISMDVENRKLEELKKRAQRNDAGIIETRHISGSEAIEKLRESADRLLLDVPCSGLGVLRRNPDAKWKLKPDFIAEIQKTQADILQRYSSMLRPGGKMVYATCSILPTENSSQVSAFLERNPDYILEKDLTLTPAQHGFDGFYMALLQKKN